MSAPKLSLTTQDIPDPYIRKNFESLRDYLLKLALVGTDELSVPIGGVIIWTADPDTLPTGWLVLRDSTLSKSKYPKLFLVWGDSYTRSGDPANVFRHPFDVTTSDSLTGPGVYLAVRYQ